MTRSRFAPSPTGFLHIGSLRTILFAYALARKDRGKFILRLEDTDQSRLVPGSEEAIYESLDWLGIGLDEGPRQGGQFGPYVQSQRLDIYRRYADELLAEGKAYYCFCSAERLAQMRADQSAHKQAPRYDRHCRDLDPVETKKRVEAGAKYVIRQKMSLSGEVRVLDALRGEIVFRVQDLDDQVLLKTDGFPTYQLAVVVDDHLMQISHVVRGEEWIPSFPKNWLLYEAFGWDKPIFIHLPLSLNKGGGKLSKRQGDVAVADYRKRGYLPEALINFSILQGWHPKGDQEILSLSEFVSAFEVKDMGIAPAVFDIDKLDFFNGYYIRQKPMQELLELARPFLADNIALSHDPDKGSDEFLTKVLATVQERLKYLSEIGELTRFFFLDDWGIDEGILAWKKMDTAAAKANLAVLSEFLTAIPAEDWTREKLEERLFAFIKAGGYQTGEMLWPLRTALTNLKASPSPFEVAWVLGKERSLERINSIL